MVVMAIGACLANHLKGPILWKRTLSTGTDSPGVQLRLPHLTDCVPPSKFLTIMSLFADCDAESDIYLVMIVESLKTQADARMVNISEQRGVWGLLGCGGSKQPSPERFTQEGGQPERIFLQPGVDH